ncbi:MAG: flagellar basal body rod protein FlgB [Rhodospirillaceae bacterium]
MDLNSMGVFKLITKKMEWLSQRQEVVAQNIANVDTPKFKPSDVSPFSFRSAIESHQRQLVPAITDPAHQRAARSGNGDSGSVTRRDRKPYETKLDGNAVVVEQQMLKLSETAQDYGLVTNLYKKNVSMLRMALGRSG